MNFNTLINHLKLWCVNKAKEYVNEQQESKIDTYHLNYTGCFAAYELEFKLSILIDKNFENIDTFQNEVLNLTEIHYDPVILNPHNKTEEYIINKINGEFCEYLREVILNKETLAPINIPYSKVIIGEEATSLIEKFNSVWHYVNTSYWFPLTGDEPSEVSDKFIIMSKYLEPYMEELKEIIGLPSNHIYSYSESAFTIEYCVERDYIDEEYSGTEIFYTDKNFSWAIYFSHENTISFAGAIVPQVKEMLIKEKEHWDKFEF